MEEGNLPVISMKLGNNASFRFDVVSHHIKETDFSVILLLDFFSPTEASSRKDAPWCCLTASPSAQAPLKTYFVISHRDLLAIHCITWHCL